MSDLEELCETLSAVDHDIVSMAQALHHHAQVCSRGAQYAASAVRNEDGTTNHAASHAASALSAAARSVGQAAALLNQAALQGQGFVARTVGGSGGAPAIPSGASAAGGSAGGLTQGDLTALDDYTGNGFMEINAALRGNVSTRADAGERADAISSALRKLPDQGGHVFRGTDLTPEQIASYVPGQVRTEAGFLSATSNERAVFPGNALFLVQSSHGKDVSSHSRFPSEREVLFDKGAQFYVARNEFDARLDKQVIVLLEV